MPRKAGGARQGATAGARSGAGSAYEAKHLEVLKSAASLFAQKGFHEASLRELARKTGRSLAGLYHYFTGKEELLYQIQHHCYSGLLAHVRQVLDDAQTPHEKVVCFISHHIVYFRRHMDEMKVLAHEDQTLSGARGKKILDLKREYSQILIDIVAEYAISVMPRPRRPPAEVAAFVLFGMMNWLYTWPKSIRNLPPELLAEHIAQIFLCGFPGCPGTTLATVRENLLCTPQRTFWKRRPDVDDD
jgi:AcrR family transcriptional regulator